MKPSENSEMANAVYNGLRLIANAITDVTASPGNDETGHPVGCLTEAVMGVTSSLLSMSRSIDRLADAVEEMKA